jgi:hypothetical protein
MLSDAPLPISLLFVATVVGMLLLVLWGAARAARAAGPGAARGVRLAGVAMGGWLALSAVLADRGFFEDFHALPPHMLLAVGPPLLAALALTASGRLDPRRGRWARRPSASWWRSCCGGSRWRGWRRRS